MTTNFARELRSQRIAQGSTSDTERKVISILKVLSESSEPLGSITIARELERYGVYLGERAIRYHLKLTDERGYTQPMGRGGRMLTPEGMEELRVALAPDQVGFILDKLELLAFKTSFDPVNRTGLLPINVSLFDPQDFAHALSIMKDAMKANLMVSSKICVVQAGEKIGSIVVPAGKIGLATVCGVVINGVLLKAGIPIESRFGGVLEIRKGKSSRFVAVISYSGTSLDPSEQYIRAKMTNVGETIRTGYGKILGNFRELPAAARSLVEQKLDQLKEAGVAGVYALGNTSEPICQVAVGVNRVGMVMLGGLNPVAAVAESGIDVENMAESGLIDYGQLREIAEL
jgi:HTH-type transcriptional regulator, global nitrogen regulator NrpRI